MSAPTHAAEADEVVLSGDRPDFTDGTDTVAKGHVQVEAGVEYGLEAETIRLPDALIRLGIEDGIEVRLTGPSAVVGGDGESLEFGAGTKLSKGLTDRFAVGVLPAVAYEGGDSATLAPSLTGLVGVQLTDGIGLSSNVGVQGALPVSVDDDQGSSVDYSASLGTGFDLSDEVGLFTEVFAVHSGQWSTYADGGVTVLVAPTLQLDAYAGMALADGPERWVGAGFVWLR
jgi:hypothetical protein